MRTKHTSCGSIVLQSSTTAYVTGTAQAMSPNDMYASGGPISNQPYGFDQLTPLYKYFKVSNFTVEVEASSGVAANTLLVLGAFSPSATMTLSATNTDTLAEQPNCSRFLLPYGPVFKVTKSFDMWKLLGVTKQEFEADVVKYVGTGASSPTIKPSFQMALGSPTGGVAQSALVTLKITYDVEWYDRIVQGHS
jgi:hypothetical protein